MAEYNVSRMVELANPILQINAKHKGGKTAERTPAKDAYGLEQTLFLCKGARVKITMNLWQKAGIINGACGTIIDFIFANIENNKLINYETKPPDWPIGIVVQLDKYYGPDAIPGIPRSIIVNPVEVYFGHDGKYTKDSVSIKSVFCYDSSWISRKNV